MEHVNAIAENVRRLRAERGWTQEHLARAARVEGRTVQRVEAGKPASSETLMSISSALDVTLDDLRGPTPEETAAIENYRQFREQHEVFRLRLIEKGSDLEPFFGAALAYHYARDDLRSKDAEDAYATLQSLIRDVGDIWADVEPEERMELARSIQPTLDALRHVGFAVTAGTHDVLIPAAGTKWTVLFVHVAKSDQPKLAAIVPKSMDIAFG